MKLIGSLTSPYVRKTRIVLAEKKIDYDFVLDSPWAEDSAVAKFNPLGKVPVLVLDDDSTLFDSRVIVEYLDNMTPNNKLFPATSRERITIKRWEALADGICDAAATAFLEAKRPKKLQDAQWIARQRGKIALGVQALAGDIGESPWCFGNSLTLADVAVGSALGYLSFRFADIDWPTQYPNLAKLYAKLMARPSFADTAPHD
ncbi:MAG: glutathione S-transferase [Rhodocyclaceae bacterium]|nr:glutathione S-transferase [Rhodocyclaceae bacterium]